MFRQILDRGGLVTEFPPGTPVRPLHFPRRNRVLAALCDALVLVEGSERSGARSTVDFALEQGREVLAVPRDILYPGSVLPNRLLRDGAAAATCVQDILELLPRAGPRADLPGSGGKAGPMHDAASGSAANSGPDATTLATDVGLEESLWRLIEVGPCSLDDCLQRLPRSGAAHVQAMLAQWEILGRVVRLPGGKWRRAGGGERRRRDADTADRRRLC
jgi:DNA processing protein